MIKYSKRIIRVCVFAILVLYSFPLFTVKALTEQEENDLKSFECIMNQDFADAYGFDMDFENGQYKFSVQLQNNAKLSSKKLTQNDIPSFKIGRIIITDVQDLSTTLYYDEFLKLQDKPGTSEYKQKIGTILADYNTEQDINRYIIGDNKILTLNTPIYVDISTDTLARVYVLLRSEEPDKMINQVCQNVISTDEDDEELHSLFWVAIDSYPSVKNHEAPAIVTPDPDPELKGKIECQDKNGKYDYQSKFSKTSFEYNFCDDLCHTDPECLGDRNKIKTIKFSIDSSVEEGLDGYNIYRNELITYNEHILRKPNDRLPEFKCDPFSFSSPYTEVEVPGSSEKKKIYNYDNQQYLLGTVNQEIIVGQYVYNYGGQDPETGISIDRQNFQVKQNIRCQVDCREVVTIEYGPPVASSAGMCFEYQIKVTSRVNCASAVINPPQMSPILYCEPRPHCWEPPKPRNTDGPNEDFAGCINECDGGRYTASCSRLCYDEVYQKSATFEKNSYLATDSFVEKLNVARDPSCTGQGYFHVDLGQSRSIIQWERANCVSRNYVGVADRFNCTKDSLNGGGIPCSCSCTLRCRWETSCNLKSNYLNPGEWQSDKDRNDSIYEAAQNACNAYSKCSTTTAKFSIDVGYNDGKTDTVIYFPYSKNDQNYDTITYKSNEDVLCSSNDAYSTIISSNGCYNCQGRGVSDSTISSSNWYQTEWGLGASWMSNKDGNLVVYEPRPSDTWTKYPFCLQFDQTNVNMNWWFAYSITNAQRSGKTFSYMDSSSTSNLKSMKPEEIFNADNADDVISNIHGHAESFGLFGWDIDVECFYGVVNTRTTKIECTKDCCSEDCQPGDSKIEDPYIIRPVDLKKLFPSSEADGEQERTPGFNWSKYASVTEERNISYISLPNNYATEIQRLNSEVYSDEYLDYYIKLTKSDLNKLKKDTSDYTKFEGEAKVEEGDSAIHYQSNLFRNGGILAGSAKYPSKQALKCNNIGKHIIGVNYQAECDNFEEVE